MTLPNDAFEKNVTIIESVNTNPEVNSEVKFLSDADFTAIADDVFEEYDDTFARLAQ